MADPCVDNKGNPVGKFTAGGFDVNNPNPHWFGPGGFVFGTPDAGTRFFQVMDGKDQLVNVTFGNDNPRVYKVANIMLDLVMNKVGWHYPQQRIISAWHDIADVYAGRRPAEPFVFRGNTR